MPTYPNFNSLYLRNIYLVRIFTYMLDVQIKYSKGTLKHDNQIRSDFADLKRNDFNVFDTLMNKNIFGLYYVKNWYADNFMAYLQAIMFKAYRFIFK